MNNLEFYRRKKGMSQTKLGLRLGIHPTNITMVEREHRRAWTKLANCEGACVVGDDLFDENGNLKGGVNYE